MHGSYLGCVNVEFITKKKPGILHLQHVQGHHLCTCRLDSLFCPFLSFFSPQFWRHVECACLLCSGSMFRLVVSGPVSLPLSFHLCVAALILGFVCSIWAKFSNGDNYRGRPGERRRWVLPFLPEWAACFSKPVNYISQHPPCVSLLIPVTVCCAIRGPVEHRERRLCRTAIHRDCSPFSN